VVAQKPSSDPETRRLQLQVEDAEKKWNAALSAIHTTRDPNPKLNSHTARETQAGKEAIARATAFADEALQRYRAAQTELSTREVSERRLLFENAAQNMSMDKIRARMRELSVQMGPQNAKRSLETAALAFCPRDSRKTVDPALLTEAEECQRILARYDEQSAARTKLKRLERHVKLYGGGGAAASSAASSSTSLADDAEIAAQLAECRSILGEVADDEEIPYDAFATTRGESSGGYMASRASATNRLRTEHTQRAIAEWHHSRAQQDGVQSIDMLHICQRGACVDTASIVCINPELRVFGCVTSGKTHACHGTTASCRLSSRGSDGTIVCLFSGFPLVQLTGAGFYDEQDAGTEFQGGGDETLDVDTAFDGDDDHDDGVADVGLDVAILEEGDAGSNAMVAPADSGAAYLGMLSSRYASAASYADHGRAGGDYAELVRELQDSGAFLPIGNGQHTSPISDGEAPESSALVIVAEDPQPQQQQQQQQQQQAFGMPIVTSSSLIVPRAAPDTIVTTDVVHTTSGRGKGRAGPLSGASLNAKRRRLLTSDTRRTIHTYINALFDPVTRQGLEVRQHSEMENAALASLQKYARLCRKKNVIPSMTQCDDIIESAMLKRRQVSSIRIDSSRMKRYEAFTYELWRIMLDTPYFETPLSRLRLHDHVIGSLHALSAGVSFLDGDGITNVTIIQPDVWLRDNLPPSTVLHRWKNIGFTAHGITTGRNHLQGALNSIETKENRDATTARLRAAYDHGTSVNDDFLHIVND